MSAKLHKAVVSTLVAGLVGVLSAPSAEANRGGGKPDYVPPVTVPDVDDIVDLDVLGSVVGVGNPNPGSGGTGGDGTNPGAGGSGGGDPLGGTDGAGTTAPAISPDAATTTPTEVAGANSSRPEAKAAPMAGLLSRTGSEAMPLVRAGLAAIALGLGFVVLSRRRRASATLA